MQIRSVLLLILPALVSSCAGFSQKEKQVLNASAELLKQVNSLKKEQQEDLKKKMDKVIYNCGERSVDRKMFHQMDKDIADFEGTFNSLIDSAEANPFSTDQSVYTQFRFFRERGCFPELDTEVKRLLRNTKKYEIMKNYAEQVSFCINCWRFYSIKPFLETESKTVERGETYSARFFLGAEALFRDITCDNPSFIFDRNGRNNGYIRYKPELSPEDTLPKKFTWNGTIRYFRDSVKVSRDFYVVNRYL